MLPTQIINLPIAGGLNEAIDYRALEAPGAWLTVNNWVYNQAGAIQKRHGYGALGRTIAVSGGTLPGTDRLDAYGSQLVAYGTDATDGTPHVYTYAPGSSRWADQGWAVPASTRREAVHRGAVGCANAHIARVNNVVMTTWEVGNLGVFYKVTDAETGAVLVDETSLGVLMYSCAMFAVGNDFVIVGYDSGATLLFAYKFNTSTLTWSSPVTVYTPTLGIVYDACPVSNTQFCVAVWDKALLQYELRLWTVSTMTSAVSNTQPILFITVEGLSVNAANGNVALALARTGPGDINLSVHDATTLAPAVVAATVFLGMATLVGIVVGYAPDGDVLVAWEGDGGSGHTGVAVQRMTTLGVAVGSTRLIFGAELGSKPFVQGDASYMLATGATLLCLTDTALTTLPLTLCGAVAAGESTTGYLSPVLTLVTPRALPCEWLEEGQWLLPLIVLTGVGYVSGQSNTGVDRAIVDFRAQQAGLNVSARAQGCLATSGGLLGWFDGQSHTELGFLQAPTILGTTVTGPGTGNIQGAAAPNNAYLYTACYEWLDEAGNLHRSAFATPVSVTVDVAHSLTTIDVEVSSLRFTRKGNVANGQMRYPRIAIWRTTIGTTAPFYRVNPPSVTVYADALVTLPYQWSVTYTDDTSDSALLAAAYGEIILQEQGGPLNNEFPPPALHVCTHKNRLWVASAEDDRAVWFSKMFVRNEGPGFNVLQQVRVDDSPDGITALASLDDKLVIFTRSRIYYVVGDGPADTGLNGGFSDPFLVTSAAGCLDARSVVTFDGGVMFQSKGGLYLLTRGLQVEFVGSAVQETFGLYNTVLAVSHDPDRSWLVWLCQRPPTGGEEFGPKAIFIVWDYLRKAWFTWTTDADDAGGMLGQAFVDGEHVWADHTTVALESYDGGTDTLGWDPGGTWVTSTLESPWIKLDGPGGYHRVRHVVLTGRKQSDHSVQVELCNDFDETVLQTQTWDVGPASTLDGLPVERIDCHVKHQKASAFKVKVSDLAPDVVAAGSPAGMTLAGVALEAGAKQGRAKLPQPNRR